MWGLLVINKPAGMTSRDVVNRVQRITRIKKCGHAGTLDPLATGVLVVCLGRGTRLVPYVQEQQKRYRAGFRFGWRSNTEDIEGELTPVLEPNFPDRQELQRQLTAMEGICQQVPPQFSAKKVKGRRAYDAARQGEVVELAPQAVRIDQLELLSYQPPDWDALVLCGSGTYVRSIGRDVGEFFGCGAIMTSLIREAIGEFSLEKSCTLEELEQQDWQRFLLPGGLAVTHLPRHVCNEEEKQHLLHGRRISAAELFVEDGRDVALFDEQGKLISIATLQTDRTLKPHHVFPEESE